VKLEERGASLPSQSALTDLTIRAYSGAADRFDRRASQAGKGSPFLRHVAARLPRGARILDLGCGSGHDAVLFARLGFRVTGVDATPEFIARARERARSLRKPRPVFFRGDMLTWRAKPSSFEAIWANASLIHARKDRLPALLRRIRRTLVPGGVLAATIHNGRTEAVSGRTWIPGRFFASYLKDELADVVRAAGFEIVQLEGVVNRDRKGRWLNLIARNGARGGVILAV
jgi:SAM-dependent methyltransferase